MSDQLPSGDEPNVKQKEHAKTESTSGSYVLSEEDEIELKNVREQLDQLQRHINKLNPPSAHLEGLKETFTWGTGGNRRSGGTQFKKRFDVSIERAAKATPLYQEHLRLLAQEKALLTGERAREREQEEVRQKKREEAAERVQHAQAGDYVIDSAYGTVRVIRSNKQSLTIETESGRRERRELSLIKRVAFTEEELIGWFVKRDASGEFSIGAFLCEARVYDKSIEEAASWLKDETYKRYPDFIRNLPWQKIVQHFLDKEDQRVTGEQDEGSRDGNEEC